MVVASVLNASEYFRPKSVQVLSLQLFCHYNLPPLNDCWRKLNVGVIAEIWSNFSSLN